MGLAGPGSEVGIVFYEDAAPHAVTTSVVSVKPFAATSTDPVAGKLRSGQRVVLVLESASTYAKAEAEISDCTESGGSWRIQMGHFGWEEIDRRRFPRYKMSLPVSLRVVHETGCGAEIQMVEGTTEDLSLGGAWVRPRQPLEPGSLVELLMNHGDQPIRILSIVARDAGGDGVGLEFLDFIGGARYHLHALVDEGRAA